MASDDQNPQPGTTAKDFYRLSAEESPPALDSEKAIAWVNEMRDALEQGPALRQALTWCVVNSGETLADHPKLLQRFRQILGMEGVND